jgi:hypothetical protein
MCAVDGGERYSNYTTKLVRARKQHRCDECDRTIEKGETYRYAQGVMEGGWSLHYICSHCEVPAGWLIENCGGYLHCGILDDIREHVAEYPALGDDLKRFVSGMRAKWTADGALMPIPAQAKPINVTDAVAVAAT